MSPEPKSPRDEYARRLALARDDAAQHDRREAKIANARLGLFVVAIGLAYAAFGLDALSARWLSAPAVAFVALIVLHDRAARTKERAARRVAIYERGMARVEDRWIGQGPSGSRFADPNHPYAADLDLFGPGSLFQRISTARTGAGERVLASWLMAPSDEATIRDRQGAVADLRPRLDLRDDLARAGASTDPAIDVEALAAWCEASEAIPLAAARLLAPILAVANTLALIAWAFLGLGDRITLGILAAGGLFAAAMARPVGRVLEGMRRKADDLGMLERTLARIEREPFSSPRLVALQGRLINDGRGASSRIAALRRRVDLLEWQRNLLFTPISLAWLWGTQVGLAIESWRMRWGREVSSWVTAAAEFEALESLSAYAFENPEDVFPTISSPGPALAAEALCHPLLPKASAVRNDVALGGDLRVLVVSGSNMSGKSTLLRSVGANVVLGLAGAPVRAARMSLSPVAIGATLRVQDSLQEGKSRFYAEILRLRQVVDLTAGPLPLLFLLDEILHGTNSHDRLEGASAVVRGLIDRGAIGLVTTHDLALAAVADTLAPRARNVHFEDRFEGGVMRFDYTMRPGVVRNSNALALMRAVGLEV